MERQGGTVPSWDTIADWLERLSGLEPQERERELRALEPDLAAELTSLLEPRERLPLTWVERRSGGRAGSVSEGVEVGAYRIERLIGRGGMGEVWLASREEAGVRRQVAIKRLRPGLVEGNVEARFRLEHRLLARLTHRSIARLLDSGTDADGRLYLVLEYVEGEPLTLGCDRLGLSIERRLEVFEEVCRAVAFAHGQLVVHRDLKPSNVLLTSAAEVRLLDFGIAKLLQRGDEAPLTRPERPVLTLEYASPEQLAGDEPGIATDVWALGILLCELLAGTRPFAARESSPEALLAAVLGDDPPELASLFAALDETRADHVALARSTTPRELRRRLRGELTTIVATALQREPSRRYGSAEQLAEDVRRYRTGWPIQARADSWSYRLRKLVGRHRAASAVVALATIGLMAAGVLVVRERDRAERERDLAQEVTRLLVSLFAADPWAGPGELSTATTLGEFLKSSDAAVRARTSADPALRAQLLLRLAQASSHLGEAGRAVELATEVVGLLGAGAAPEIRAEALDALGTALQEAGRWDEAEGHFRAALEQRRRSLGADGLETADSETNLATLLQARGRAEDLAEAEKLQLRALETRISRLGLDHLATAQAFNNLGVLRASAGGAAAAAGIPDLRRGLEIRQRLLGDDHALVATTANNLAAALLEIGELGEAERLYRQAIAVWERRLGADHPRVSTGYWGLSHVLEAQGDFSGALAAVERSQEIDQVRLPSGHPYLEDGVRRRAELALRLEVGS